MLIAQRQVIHYSGALGLVIRRSLGRHLLSGLWHWWLRSISALRAVGLLLWLLLVWLLLLKLNKMDNL